MSRRSTSSGSGPSQRQLRVGELLRRALSDVLTRREVHDPELESISITVGEVRMSPDLRNATVFVSRLGGGDIDPVLEALARNRRELRHIVTKSIHLKYSPELKFLADTSFDRMDATNALLAGEQVQRDIAGEPDRDGEQQA